MKLLLTQHVQTLVNYFSLSPLPAIAMFWMDYGLSVGSESGPSSVSHIITFFG
jgi:hypothetical protein